MLPRSLDLPRFGLNKNASISQGWNENSVPAAINKDWSNHIKSISNMKIWDIKMCWNDFYINKTSKYHGEQLSRQKHPVPWIYDLPLQRGSLGGSTRRESPIDVTPPKRGPFQKEFSYSNHWFSGDMLVFQGVSEMTHSFLYHFILLC